LREADCAATADEFQRILRAGLEAAHQPILHVDTGAVVGYEVLTRGRLARSAIGSHRTEMINFYAKEIISAFS
jgi:EAL domain-containing protein (putative c-di-GMP-specific phosphodiesterase class I)